MPQFLNGFGLLLDLLLQFPGGFDFQDHFGTSAGLFKGRVDEVPHQRFQVAKAKHFNDRSAKMWMKKAVFPEGVKGPVSGFHFFGTTAIENKAVWARLAKGFSCVASSVQNVNCLFRRFAVHGVRAYFVCKHNFGLKNFAPRNTIEKKKKKKRKCSDRVEGKCDAIFFQKNFGAKF